MNKSMIRYFVIAVVVLFGLVFGIAAYHHKLNYPTTDDGTVVSDVVQISSRIDGPIIQLKVSDYQRVKKGDLLYIVDPEPYNIALAEARAAVVRTRENIQMLADNVDRAKAEVMKAESNLEFREKQYHRKKVLTEKGAVSQSSLDRAKSNLIQAIATVDSAKALLNRSIHDLGEEGEQNAELKKMIAAKDKSELDLSFTHIVAPQSGYVTNLRVSEGTYTSKGSPILTLVSDTTWRVIGLMRETQLRKIRPGQSVKVFLPAYPNQVFRGKVHGVGWAISPEIINVQARGLTETSPTLDWVRLAQRFPVEVKLTEEHPEFPYRVGMTATVQVDASYTY